MKKELNKILYVEDDPDIQTIASISLINIGKFNIRACNSGKEALEQIYDFDPELVLSDVMMPEIDGPTMLKTLRNDPEYAKYSKIPVIFISARAQKHQVEEYMKIGATEVFAKPFDPLALPNDIKEVWKRL